MPRCRFVDPTSEIRIALSDDDWIVVRRELSVGQQREMYQAMRRKGSDAIDLSLYPTARALAYVVRWSFVDYHGAAAPVTAGAIDLLEPSTLTEITAAIDAHDDAVDAEKKRISTGAPDSDRILLSVGS